MCQLRAVAALYVARAPLFSIRTNSCLLLCSHSPTEQLWHLARKVAGADILDKAKAAGGKALVLDVNAQGITKVLGKGLIPELPIIIKARYVSKLAEEKIRAAGGAVILTA